MRCRPTLCPVDSVGEFGGLERMHADRRVVAAAGTARRPSPCRPCRRRPRTHRGAARRPRAAPDLRAGRRLVRRGVVVVRELPRQERSRVIARRAPRRARCCRGSRRPRRLTEPMSAPKLRDQVDALAAHPVRHEDRDRMAERAADGGERDAGVAARRLDDGRPARARRRRSARSRMCSAIRSLMLPSCSGLGLRVTRRRRRAAERSRCEQRRVADQAREAMQAVEAGAVHGDAQPNRLRPARPPRTAPTPARGRTGRLLLDPGRRARAASAGLAST